MKVKDLIEKLKEYPNDLIVVSDGYEDGFDIIQDVSIRELYRDKNKSWWTGDYVEDEIPGVEKEKCVYLRARSSD